MSIELIIAYSKKTLMNHVFQSTGRLVVFLTVLLFAFSSCVDTKKAVYFNNAQEGKLDSKVTVPETRIQNNDLLSITITSTNADASSPFNPTTQAASQTPGYLVGRDGTIDLPTLGNIKAAGFTKDELRATIKKMILDKKLLNDPTVIIRYVNYRVTVLGDVASPGVITVPSEKISLLEALGTSGDIQINGKRDNVLIVREENGEKVLKRINLNSTELFSSDYYYLKANDVVYVEPGKSKIINSEQRIPAWVGLALSVVTLALSVATFIKF
jgi:polysaccharide export outer membrane protein